MLGFGKEATARLRTTLGKSEWVAALLGQAIRAQPAEQHIIRSLVFGVQLKAVALEQLRLEWPALDLNFALSIGREAEDWEPAILFPELANAAATALIGFRKAALIALGGGDRGDQETKEQRDEPTPSLHRSLLAVRRCMDTDVQGRRDSSYAIGGGWRG